jgi:hypothetical protein
VSDEAAAAKPVAPLIIDMKCSCGAHLVIECKAFTEYTNASALLGLAKSWSDIHRHVVSERPGT